MNKSLSITASLIRSAKSEGKLVTLNTADHVKLITEMNKQLETARRDYKIKEMQSMESASKAILTI
ncbi:MAG: hypothetical protein RBS07_18735 [Lentimicrobium sp.]|jgi:hypothetical protein|nr:hypothetical protein [Lentimicrobium sp.]